MSIGEVLAAGRRQAGLTVTQVSERTRIRETIVRGIEHDDFSGCGGDFYARGHIRAIARAAGVDPEPLIREYDASQEPAEDEAAPEERQPSGPIRLRERRRWNWTVALVVILAAVVGVLAYHIVSSPAASTTAAGSKPAAHKSAPARPTPSRTPSPTPTTSSPATTKASPPDVTIALSAGTGACWVNLTTSDGATIFQGTLDQGQSKSWTERQAVTLQLGNPQVVSLTVDGKSRSGLGADPVTLDLAPGQTTAAG